MRFKQYINESQRSANLSEDDALNLVFDKCKNALQAYRKGTIIYRGTSGFNSKLVDPKKSPERESANTHNYYTLIFNNHKLWNKFPNREIICTLDKRTAFDYGDTNEGVSFVVFPFDGAKVGVCPAEDMWYSFKKLNGGLESFMYFLHGIFELTGHVPQTYKELQKCILKINKSEYKDEIYDRCLSFNLDGNEFLNSVKDFDKFVATYFDPKKNNFKVTSINNIKGKLQEVWIDSKAVLIPAEAGILHEIS